MLGTVTSIYAQFRGARLHQFLLSMQESMVTDSNDPAERFCPQCGHSVAPLDRPHVARACDKCERTIYLIEAGEGGRGIRVRAGDRFTIPSGWLKLSLNPAIGSGKLFRRGVGFVVKQMIMAGGPRDRDKFQEILDVYEKTADGILEASEVLSDLDLESEDDATEAIERLESQPDSREWFALLLGTFTATVRDAIEAGDPTQAAWAMQHATTAHSMTVVRDPVFEQTLWRGYLANQVVYDAASAASQTQAEAEALQQLSPIFSELDEATLHAWVHGGLPIGPRIGVTSLPEELIHALAQWHLAAFDRRRQEEQQAQQDQRALRDIRIKAAGVGIAGTGVVVTLLKALGVL